MNRQKSPSKRGTPQPVRHARTKGPWAQRLVQLASDRPLLALFSIFLIFLWFWLPTLATFSYNTSSDMGFHLYNLKQFGDSGFSFYNAQWFVGQEYLTAYSPGTALIGSALSWVAPGIVGAVFAYAVVVALSVWLALFGAALLARQLGGSSRTMIVTALLYTFSPFLWRSLQHSLPDFFGYALLPGVLAYWISLSSDLKSYPVLSLHVLRKTILFGMLFSVLFLGSAIVAFHAAACMVLLGLVASVQQKKLLLRQLGTLLISMLVVIGCTAFWLFPFVETLFDPGYGGDKLSATNGSSWVESIAASLSSKALLADGVALISPLSRHSLSFLLLVIVFIGWPLLRSLSVREKTMIYPWYGIAIFGGVVAFSSVAGAMASFGFGILLEHQRWYDIVHLSLAILAGIIIGKLADQLFESTVVTRTVRVQNRRVSKIRSIACCILACFTLIVGGMIAVSSEDRDSVWKTKARLSPVYEQLQQDGVGERVAIFPFLQFVPGDLEHSRPMLFGSCLACNRNEKIALMQQFESLQYQSAAGELPAGVSEIAQPDRLAGTLGSYGVRSVLVTYARSYPEINLSIDYPISVLLKEAPGITLVGGSRSTEQVSAWKFTLADGGTVIAIPNASNLVSFSYPITSRSTLWCPLFATIGASIPPLQLSCSSGVLTISPGVLVGRSGMREQSVVLPRGVSPVADKLLDGLGPVRQFTPFVTVTKVTTTVAIADMLYTVEPVLPYTTGTVQLGRSSSTQLSGVVLPLVSNRSVLIREGYAPGWHASIGGRSVPVRSEQGFLSFDLPPEAQPGERVEVRYRGTRAARLGQLVTALALAGATLLIWVSRPPNSRRFLKQTANARQSSRRASKRS